MTADNTPTETNTNIPTTDSTDIDGLFKLMIVIALAITPFYLEKEISLAFLFAGLLIATVVTKIKFRTLLLSAASYFIIVLIPYLFGYFMSELLYLFTNNDFFAYKQSGYEVFLRVFRLFVIWYVSILYFHTTPMNTVIGLMDKLLYPLKLVRVPVRDFLNIIVCIVAELKGKGTELKDSFMENARSAIGGEKIKLRTKIKGVSHIIVSLLINSFEKINDIQNSLENLNTDELYNYRIKISLKEIVVVLIFAIFISGLFVVEKGYI